MSTPLLSRAAAPLALAAALLATPWAVKAQTPATLVPAASEITFTTTPMGVPVEGKFGKFSAQVALDPKKPETGKVVLTIDTGSARFGTPELDGEIGKPVWLSTAKFPQAMFQSTRISAAGGGRFQVAGKLTIKGASQDVVVPVQVTQAGGTSTATGTLKIKRLAFKVGDGEWADTSMLADEVQIRFKLALTGLAPL
ncbi:YceI family protein [Rubrivivax gelatinosus]|uniref:Polyisoprenoid-binding protein YceI n=1 Tax=Rubrivivax gelatinosus TaxID=28068 RepID=A0A4R2M3I8_RUBGE|nr:YceI family protein [Rubrivivax gelatinosus]MBK1689942.1 polyisoprenoid-binding protein [Rubrivivax gelatinosus]TCO98756.1 polyisoprenoid-binding protein YceI [Rubrivivax gelatinosus]